MNKVKKRKKKRLKSQRPIQLTLIVILLLLTSFSTATFAKYGSGAASDSGARVAVFANDVSFTLPVEDSFYPGCEILVPFNVCNFDGDKICEVTQEYAVTLTRFNSTIPLVIEWYACAPADVENNTPLEGAPTGTFLASEGESIDYYTIRITWDNSVKINSSFEYSTEVEVLRIKVACDQVD